MKQNQQKIGVVVELINFNRMTNRYFITRGLGVMYIVRSYLQFLWSWFFSFFVRVWTIFKQIYLTHKWNFSRNYYSGSVKLVVIAVEEYSRLPRAPEKFSVLHRTLLFRRGSYRQAGDTISVFEASKTERIGLLRSIKELYLTPSRGQNVIHRSV